MQLIGGLFLAFTVIAPVADIDLDRAFDVPLDFSLQGDMLAAQGQSFSKSEMETIISQHCRSYILDKAVSYHAQLEVEVTLSQDDLPVPTAVRLQGSVSPYAKKELQQWIEDEMGIRKENQIWIG